MPIRENLAAPMLLPHELFSDLANRGDFEANWTTPAEFWKGLHPDDPQRWRMPPLEEQAHTLPLRVHGDGVAFTQKQSLMAGASASVNWEALGGRP